MMIGLANRLVEGRSNGGSHPMALRSREGAHDVGSVCEIGTHVPWYAVVAGTVLAVAYVTYQLIYLLPVSR